jgi:hypothetical protein
MLDQFYSYVHARPGTVEAAGIFYVGKGKRQRFLDFRRRGRYYLNIVKKHGKENILVGRIDCSSEELAFDLEMGLIKCLRQMGVKLVNATDGGEGPSGCKFTPERRARHSAILKRALSRPEEIERKSKKTKEMWQRPEYRDKQIAIANELWQRPGARENHGALMKQTFADPVVRSSISIGTLRGLAQPGVLERRNRALAEALARPEVRANISAASKEAWSTPERRESRSKYCLKFWENEAMRENHSRIFKNKIWITNGVRTSRIDKESPVPPGWRLGRK